MEEGEEPASSSRTDVGDEEELPADRAPSSTHTGSTVASSSDTAIPEPSNCNDGGGGGIVDSGSIDGSDSNMEEDEDPGLSSRTDMGEEEELPMDRGPSPSPTGSSMASYTDSATLAASGSDGVGGGVSSRPSNHTASSDGYDHRKAFHTRYVTEASRYNSFKEWPRAMPQTPRQLTDAGFFYLGRGDHVQCFYCDIGLKNWEATDKPWVEHVKWSRNCAYVLHKMGAEFVELVLSNAPIDDGMLHNFEKQASSNSILEGLGLSTTSRKVDPALREQIESLAKENQELRNERKCKVCLANDIQVLFLDCGHFVSCVDCAASVTACPMCRKEIAVFVRSY